jgi:hypothetical protein
MARWFGDVSADNNDGLGYGRYRVEVVVAARDALAAKYAAALAAERCLDKERRKAGRKVEVTEVRQVDAATPISAHIAWGEGR